MAQHCSGTVLGTVELVEQQPSENIIQDDKVTSQVDQIAETTTVSPSALLHEMCLQFKISLPNYELKEKWEDTSAGEVFQMLVSVTDMGLEAVGSGYTKKAAKQEATLNAFSIISDAAKNRIPLKAVLSEVVIRCSAFIKHRSEVAETGKEVKEPEAAGAVVVDDVPVVPRAIARLVARAGARVSFHKENDVGPPHNRDFIMTCRCGDHTTMGRGKSKKAAKNAAASAMLAKLGL